MTEHRNGENAVVRMLKKVVNRVFLIGRIRVILRIYPVWKNYLPARDRLLCCLDILRKKEVVRKIGFGDQLVYVRTNTSDLSVAVSCLCEKEFDQIHCRDPKVIVDAGAYIGASTIFFANKFPAAKIIAIEPEEENFALLKKNTEGLNNVIVENTAIWGEKTDREIKNRSTGSWGFTVVDLDAKDMGQTVSCTTLPDIIAQHDISRIDILKMDIEGSEKDVLEKSSGWIGKVDVLIVELHDRIVMGCSRAFYLATSDFKRFDQSGEKLTAYRH